MLLKALSNAKTSVARKLVLDQLLRKRLAHWQHYEGDTAKHGPYTTTNVNYTEFTPSSRL